MDKPILNRITQESRERLDKVILSLTGDLTFNDVDSFEKRLQSANTTEGKMFASWGVEEVMLRIDQKQVKDVSLFVNGFYLEGVVTVVFKENDMYDLLFRDMGTLELERENDLRIDQLRGMIDFHVEFNGNEDEYGEKVRKEYGLDE